MALPRIFDLFRQTDEADDRSRPGLGIGLALVRNLVETHGGTVIATSAGPGKGSEFPSAALGRGYARQPIASIWIAAMTVGFVRRHTDCGKTLLSPGPSSLECRMSTARRSVPRRQAAVL